MDLCCACLVSRKLCSILDIGQCFLSRTITAVVSCCLPLVLQDILYFARPCDWFVNVVCERDKYKLLDLYQDSNQILLRHSRIW